MGRARRSQLLLLSGLMVARGASGSPEELQMVVDYLAKYLGPKVPVNAASKP